MAWSKWKPSIQHRRPRSAWSISKCGQLVFNALICSTLSAACSEPHQLHYMDLQRSRAHSGSIVIIHAALMQRLRGNTQRFRLSLRPAHVCFACRFFHDQSHPRELFLTLHRVGENECMLTVTVNLQTGGGTVEKLSVWGVKLNLSFGIPAASHIMWRRSRWGFSGRACWEVDLRVIVNTFPKHFTLPHIHNN